MQRKNNDSHTTRTHQHHTQKEVSDVIDISEPRMVILQPCDADLMAKISHECFPRKHVFIYTLAGCMQREAIINTRQHQPKEGAGVSMNPVNCKISCYGRRLVAEI